MKKMNLRQSNEFKFLDFNLVLNMIFFFSSQRQLVYGIRSRYESKKLETGQVALLYHIHTHLQYFPYVCTKCKDHPFRAPFIGREFFNHLNTVHGITFNLENNNADCYEKRYHIDLLDKLIEKHYRTIY